MVKYSGFLLLLLIARDLSPRVFSSLAISLAIGLQKCKQNCDAHKKCTRLFSRSDIGNCFSIFVFAALKYLPTDDVNINDQLIGVDQRSLAANKFCVLFCVAPERCALKFQQCPFLRYLWGQSFIVVYLKVFREPTKKNATKAATPQKDIFARRSME